MALIFYANHLPAATSEYVVWIDVMGTQASMSRSLSVTANFIFKLHAAALQAPQTEMHLYPVMDGLYASSPSQDAILEFLRSVLVQVATEFNGEPHLHFRFVVRGGLAFGPVIHGRSVREAACPVVGADNHYKEAILLGMPMVQAHLSEVLAPPFGIQVHESARSFAPVGTAPLHQVWWTWNNGANSAIWNSLKTELPRYLDWCKDRALRIDYPSERIEVHREMVRQYFA
jgi:hypothetical protein